MFMIFKRKQIATVSVAIFLVIAFALSYKPTQEQSIATSSQSTDEIPAATGDAVLVSTQNDVILNARNNREVVRSKACEILNRTISDENISHEGKKQAENKLISIAENMDNEVKCESVLSAKGFGECVVFISDTSVNVTVAKNDLSTEDVAKINDIISELTGNNNIKIVEVK